MVEPTDSESWIWPRSLGSGRAGLIWLERRQGEEARGGGKDTHVSRLGGAGVQRTELCGRAEFKSLYAYRGNGRKED
jgi:hypothetical protein